jgi:DNA-binding response OmpR family regulator
VPVILRDFQSPGATCSVIIVADNSALVRNIISMLMQQDGYFVLSASDGVEALDLSRQYPGSIDLAIMDIEMCRLDGTDLCAHLLAERPGIKVLVTSGAGIGEGASGDRLPILHKPFDGKTLRAKVRTMLVPPGRTLDLTGLVSELYAELEQIDQEILALEESETGPEQQDYDDPDAIW